MLQMCRQGTVYWLGMESGCWLVEAVALGNICAGEQCGPCYASSAAITPQQHHGQLAASPTWQVFRQ